MLMTSKDYQKFSHGIDYVWQLFFVKFEIKAVYILILVCFNHYNTA